MHLVILIKLTLCVYTNISHAISTEHPSHAIRQTKRIYYRTYNIAERNSFRISQRSVSFLPVRKATSFNFSMIPPFVAVGNLN
jgi:hypothetical protein